MSEETGINKIKRATADLSNAAGQNTSEFFRENFGEVLEKGRLAVTVIGKILEGQRVRRSYFFSSSTSANRPETVEITVTKVTMEGAGIVRIYDAEGNLREFPAMQFNFQYRQDGKAVFCVSPEYSVLFEQI